MIPITEKTPPTMASRRVMRWDSGTCSSVTVMRKGDSSYTKKIPGMTPAWETEREERDERERREEREDLEHATSGEVSHNHGAEFLGDGVLVGGCGCGESAV
jgi:hypothetical protein